MAEIANLNKPWLVAIWPGMGGVAINAGYYMVAKLDMRLLAEFSLQALFDLEYVEVKNGLIRCGPLPRSRLFAWTDPNGKHDIAVFIGEAQPTVGKSAFCQSIVEHAKQLGVERVFTFAAMATQMNPEHASRVFGAATDEAGLKELGRLEIELLEDGRIGGLNGVLLGIAAEAGLPGTCLLGEMPHIFAQLPYPKASLAVLEVFNTIAGMRLDLGELSEQASMMDERLGELLTRAEGVLEEREASDQEQETAPESSEEGKLRSADERRIEQLFEQAQRDRSKAYELKGDLDRLGVFKEYEDRFLDLFRRTE